MVAQQHPIMILGETGQLARALKQALGSKAVSISRADLDFTDMSPLSALLDRYQPAAVINAVAYTQVDRAEEEKELAYTINAHAPGILAEACKQRAILLVHYSTDYVFNGKGSTPFREEDPTAPVNVYGASKRAGEEAIIAQAGDYLIFRTSWVFDATGKNFFTTMLRLGKERDSLNVVSDQIGAPSYAPHLAEATIEALVQATHMQRFPSGIYHMCNQGETSWHGFASTIFAQARESGVDLTIQQCHAIPSTDYPPPAARPHNSRLNGQTLEQTFDVVLPDWREGVVDACAIYAMAHHDTTLETKKAAT